jgi:hypothetical protein
MTITTRTAVCATRSLLAGVTHARSDRMDRNPRGRAPRVRHHHVPNGGGLMQFEEEGRVARRAGKSLNSCPYLLCRTEDERRRRSMWDMGWLKEDLALRRGL